MIIKLVDSNGISYMEALNVDLEGVEAVFGFESKHHTHTVQSVVLQFLKKGEGKNKDTIEELTIDKGKHFSIVGEVDVIYYVVGE